MSPDLQAPARVVEPTTALAGMESSERWQHLQALRRGVVPVEPVLQQLQCGQEAASPDLLAALIARLDRTAVEQLLRGPAGSDPSAVLTAARQEFPLLAGDPRVLEAWLEPLLACPPLLPWLEMLGHFRDPRAAQRLSDCLQEAVDRPDAWDRDALAPLLPLLGQQRRAQDAALLLSCALEPASLLWRRAALEALAVGLSAWPLPALTAGLQQLARDLDPGLAAQAVDLLARLPHGQQALRQLRLQQLDPGVAARLQRRLKSAPLVLVVHGRQGGEIPAVLQDLAVELERRRGAPVLLQALTAPAPEADALVLQAAQRSGLLLLVPLLLLPGEHVRRDVPELAAQWRRQLGGAIAVRRQPFLGAWPAWQQLLAAQWQAAAAGRSWCWLHHPLEGALSGRYLQHLTQVLGAAGLAAPYQSPGASLPAALRSGALLAPLTLAPNRLSESLRMDEAAASAEVLPPLLQLPAVRAFLLASLEALP